MKILDTISSWVNMCVNYIGPNRYLQAAAILIVGFLIALLATIILRRVIGRVTRFSKTEFDDRFIKLLNRPIFMTIFIIASILAIGRLKFEEPIHGRSVSALKTISVWVWMVFAMRFSRLILQTLNGFRDRFTFVDSRTLPLLQNIALIVILLASVYAFMNAWNIDVTALVASAGILGLALSFAAKDTLANVFAGVSILADNPYKIGDFVVLGSGERGRVTSIGVRSTRILTRDDVEITVPNAVIGNAKIINETGGPHEKYRIRSKISVSYKSDLDQVCEVLNSIAVNHPGICTQPAPRVRVRSFGDHGVAVELLSWVAEPVLRGKMSHELNLEIFRQFRQHNIEIPYPQQDVYVRSVPAEQTP